MKHDHNSHADFKLLFIKSIQQGEIQGFEKVDFPLITKA